ncbi:MAG: hypothetical protein ACFE85_13955 [Candidatus Hodarchaeota archaeon]
MSKIDPDFLKFFGEIKFAEEKSMSAGDFERSMANYFKKEKIKVPRGRYKFAEVNSPAAEDFEESFNQYFE